MQRTALRFFGTLAIVMVVLPPPASGQELKRDSVWNGVVAGAAVGAGMGVVVGRTTEEICSAPACAALLAIAGGALGHLIDGKIGDLAPVVPGQRVDDSKTNGALIGAGVMSAAALIGMARSCGTGPNQVPCTAGGTVRNLWRAAIFGAIIGALVDAALPTEARAGSSADPSRHLALGFNVTF